MAEHSRTLLNAYRTLHSTTPWQRSAPFALPTCASGVGLCLGICSFDLWVRDHFCHVRGLAIVVGWMSWEIFRCQTDCANHPTKCVNAALYTEMADHLAADGYVLAGYESVSIDDCWEAPRKKGDALTGYVLTSGSTRHVSEHEPTAIYSSTNLPQRPALPKLRCWVRNTSRIQIFHKKNNPIF